MTQELYKYLDKQTSLSNLESFIYNTRELETQIGKNNYQSLLEFNYNQENADLEFQNLLSREIIQDNEFSNWKANQLIDSLELKDHSNLFSKAINNSNLLKGKNLSFNQISTNIEIEILWKTEIPQFHRHISELKKEAKFLNLAT